jgi:hypothetical protein
MKRLLLVVPVLIVLAIGFAVPADAQEPVLAGFDLWTTDESQSFADLAGLDALVPGCSVIGDPMIQIKGLPFIDPSTCPGGDLGNTDTIIIRLQDTPPLIDPTPVQVPIQIVELHLQSVEPFQVDCEGEEQMWMLDITIDPPPQPQGQMEIIKTHPGGGDFRYQPLVIEPLFTFTRVDIPPVIAAQEPVLLPLVSPPAPWSYNPEPGSLEVPGCTSNFFPGVGPGGSGAPASLTPPVPVTLTGFILTWTLVPPAGGPVGTEEATWGRVKSLYRQE